MTTAAETADFDFSDLDDNTVKATDGPLTGSRTRPGTTRRRRASGKRLDSLKSKLSEQMFMAGTLVGATILPVTGMYACQESAAFTSAVVDLAASRPEWIAALEKLSMMQPGLIVGRTAVGLGAALAIDREMRKPESQQKLKPDSHMMKLLGVFTAWKRVQDKVTPDEYTAGNSTYVPPPAAFSPVE